MVDDKMQAVITAELAPEDAARVLAALEAVTTDPGVGTVLHNPATGDVALRVGQYGEFYWRIYATDDRTWIEKEPLVGWDVLHKAAAPVVAPAQVDPAEEPAATPKKK
jgi:hypothetical protein